jgi:hypothetical protein
MSLLTPQAVQGYASVLDYESHILVRSLYHESMRGALPINPAHYAGRYALKYETRLCIDIHINMALPVLCWPFHSARAPIQHQIL